MITLQRIARGGDTLGHEKDWFASFSVVASLFSDAPEGKVLEASEPPSFGVSGFEPPWN